MRLIVSCFLMTACTFNVEPLAVDPQPPPSNPGLSPTPSLPPASTPTDAPDLASAPDLTTAPDLAPSTLTCTQDCRVNVPDNTSATIVCDADCDVTCGAGATCNVECGRGVACTCKGPGCTITGCMPMKCKGMELVCNAMCE
jgi:hypothetical protein